MRTSSIGNTGTLHQVHPDVTIFLLVADSFRTYRRNLFVRFGAGAFARGDLAWNLLPVYLKQQFANVFNVAPCSCAFESEDVIAGGKDFGWYD